jgi:MarR family transcriptional regulator, organic hydroperoxide resistance regulator
MLFVVGIGGPFVRPAWPKPLPLDSQLCFSIYSASVAIQRVYKPMLNQLGVTYTQYLVLSALWESDGLTISAIGVRLSLEPSTITPAVKRLEASGFVARRRSATDERLVEVYLTPNGAHLRPQTACLTDALLRHSGFDVAQMIELNKLVQTLRQDMRRATGEDPEAMDAKPVAD